MNLAVCRNRRILLEDESRNFEAVSYVNVENSKRSIENSKRSILFLQ